MWVFDRPTREQRLIVLLPLTESLPILLLLILISEELGAVDLCKVRVLNEIKEVEMMPRFCLDAYLLYIIELKQLSVELTSTLLQFIHFGTFITFVAVLNDSVLEHGTLQCLDIVEEAEHVGEGGDWVHY